MPSVTQFVARDPDEVFDLITSPTPLPGGCNVTVSYALHPSTFWRRVLLVRIRSRQLARREVPDSLRSLALYAEPAPNP
jgi:hypothetical protein